MIFTNKLDLPQYIVDWLENDDYDYDDNPNTVSATSLLKPVRVRLLTLRHSSKLQMDVSDLIASRFGNAIHDSIERINTPGFSKEQRVRRNLVVNGTEYTITGKYDLLQENEDGSVTIRDIKTTSTWAYIYGGKDDDYIKQMSIYRWLLSETYQEIKSTGYIDFFFTDWQKSKARQDDDYPKQRIFPGYGVKLLEPEATEDRIIKKLEVLQEHENTPDDDLPFCTPEELWQTDDTWAVYKNGNKRATKVCDSEDAAYAYKSEKNINGYVQHRPGKVKRCGYCSALPFCNQAKSLEKAGLLQL